MQIWNSSLSINERKDVPEEFVKELNKTKDIIDVLLNNDNIYKQRALWNEILLQACFMHKDAIEITSQWLNKKFFEDLDFTDSKREILERQLFEVAYFIGNAETEKQREVFDCLLDFDTENDALKSFKLQALCISLWRGESLLKKISSRKISEILEVLYLRLRNELSSIEREEKITNRILNPTRYYLELLCNLIRARDFGTEYKEIFSPFQLKMRYFIALVEKFYLLFQSRGKELIPRQIKFTIDDENKNSFLDYLLSWLDGENSSEMPRIESATSENQDDVDLTDSDEQ